MKDIWNKEFKRNSCLAADINSLEKKMSIFFPKMYIEIMLIQNGGTLNKYCFEYRNAYVVETMYSGASCFFRIDPLATDAPEGTVEEYVLDPPEFFPKGLIAFADDGGGNLTCFDYRNTKADPPIVFWCRDDSEGEDVHFLANNFEEFINMLHEPTD
jgi:hypothetical protein